MRVIVCTNNPVVLSCARARLESTSIRYAVFDDNMSSVDGSLDILPRRLVIHEDDYDDARRLLERDDQLIPHIVA